MAEIVITRDGLERLRSELDRLSTEGPRESAEYLDAREHQALLEDGPSSHNSSKEGLVAASLR